MKGFQQRQLIRERGERQQRYQVVGSVNRALQRYVGVYLNRPEQILHSDLRKIQRSMIGRPDRVTERQTDINAPTETPLRHKRQKEQQLPVIIVTDNRVYLPGEYLSQQSMPRRGVKYGDTFEPNQLRIQSVGYPIDAAEMHLVYHVLIPPTNARQLFTLPIIMFPLGCWRPWGRDFPQE